MGCCLAVGPRACHTDALGLGFTLQNGPIIPSQSGQMKKSWEIPDPLPGTSQASVNVSYDDFFLCGVNSQKG